MIANKCCQCEQIFINEIISLTKYIFYISFNKIMNIFTTVIEVQKGSHASIDVGASIVDEELTGVIVLDKFHKTFYGRN